MLTVSIDAAHAVELAEILTYLLEGLDTHAIAWRLLLAAYDPYGLEDLPAQLTRLIKTLDATT